MNALAGMTGLSLLLCPPHLVTDLLAVIVTSLLAQAAGTTDTALVLDTQFSLADRRCGVSFLLIPTDGSVASLLAPLGLVEIES
jgi:chemotaxis protein CheY-P-specific phosphatase CheC